MTTDIASRMNLNMLKYLPKAYEEFTYLREFRHKVETWIDEKDSVFDEETFI